MSDSRTSLSCPVCGTDKEFAWRFEKKGRQFWRCTSCGLEKQNPLPCLEELKEYYEQSYASGMYQTFAAAGDMKRLTAAQRLREMRGYVPLSGRWLDVGCANGVFVEAAMNAGIQAEGVELSENAVAEGRDRGLLLSAGTVADLDPVERFDCITAFDVLEHVIDPVTFLHDVTQRLNPGGYLVLTVPNRRSWPARIMGRRWYFYIPEEHLHYFDPSTIRSFTERNGLLNCRVKRTYKPLTFDYSLTQFSEYNPLIYRILNTMGAVIPQSLRNRIIPLYIGEMMCICQTPELSRASLPASAMQAADLDTSTAAPSIRQAVE